MQSINKLKEILLPVVLRNIDFAQTNISEVRMGAFLSQQDAEGCKSSSSSFSRKLTKVPTVEKECLAIKLSIEAFQVYLLEKEF